MIKKFLEFYVKQKIARMIFGGIFGFLRGIYNKNSTDLSSTYEKSLTQYQKKMGKTVTKEEFKKFASSKIDQYQASLMR